ncbi:DUF3450 domain-containing protein [Larsenimonas suaedae]|uniref:DUF3450 domain-containing protein n=1 Tax=Larsenimonas suaedae TaxID=1851019 RepID=A0ABU1GUX8_9GAMM|nr:DUF3450 domain-containing protein [Larsenimonas suaedae]MCM2971136.1 DUF3450 domain-containing protein [Larsenimonas suaedae]MDR5895845.1 DUF3450 domain-containing protein [Larsenimonas suaedae]
MKCRIPTGRLAAMTGALGVALLSLPAIGAPSALRDATTEHQATQQAIQSAINDADDETKELLIKLRDTEQSAKRLSTYNESLERQVNDQSQRIKSQTRALEQAGSLKQALPSELEAMVSRLRALVEADLPFRRDDRLARIDSLETMLGQSDMSASDKLKRILSVWRAEIGYGDGLDTWRGALSLDEKADSEAPAQVQFVRIGRVGYYYLSLDGKRGAVWREGAWQPLEHDQVVTLRHAVKMAHDQQAPELLTLPLSLDATQRGASAATDNDNDNAQGGAQ